MKRGKSEVVECDHTIVLGWSSKLLVLLDQLCMVGAVPSGSVLRSVSIGQTRGRVALTGRHQLPCCQAVHGRPCMA